jgi:hypothetical protein
MITVVKRGHPHREGAIRFSVGRGSSGVGRHCIPAHALGNPTSLQCEADRNKHVESYKIWLTEQIETKNKAVCHALNRIFLTAKREEVELECFCHPKACHADVIKQVI